MNWRMLSLCAAMSTFVISAAQAEKFNQPRHLQVGSMVKVQRVITKSKVLSSEARKQAKKSGKPACGEDRDGVIVDRSGNEDLIVVTKDIINTEGDVEIGRDCR